jgi:hypothetical protein
VSRWSFTKDLYVKLASFFMSGSVFYEFSFSQERAVKNFSQVDAELGRRLTEGLRKHSKSSTIASANL